MHLNSFCKFCAYFLNAFIFCFQYIFFCKFSVQILDENDSPPVLHLPKNVIQISEYHDISEVVVHVKATDNDDSTTLNGQIEMSISGGNGMGIIYIKFKYMPLNLNLKTFLKTIF